MRNCKKIHAFTITTLCCVWACDAHAAYYSEIQQRSGSLSATHEPKESMSQPSEVYGAVPIPSSSATQSTAIYGAVPIPAPSLAATGPASGSVPIPTPSSAALQEAYAIRKRAEQVAAMTAQSMLSPGSGMFRGGQGVTQTPAMPAAPSLGAWSRLRNAVINPQAPVNPSRPQPTGWGQIPLGGLTSSVQKTSAKPLVAGPQVRSSSRGYALKADAVKPLYIQAHPNTHIVIEVPSQRAGIPAEQYIIKGGTIDPTSIAETGISFDSVWSSGTPVGQQAASSVQTLASTNQSQVQSAAEQAPTPRAEQGPPPPLADAPPPPPEDAPPPPSEDAPPPPSEDAPPPP